jgi:hypothetical protein
VTVGSVVSGTLVTAATNGALTWRPSASALDMYNKASTTTIVNESGAADSDF